MHIRLLQCQDTQECCTARTRKDLTNAFTGATTATAFTRHGQILFFVHEDRRQQREGMNEVFVTIRFGEGVLNFKFNRRHIMIAEKRCRPLCDCFDNVGRDASELSVERFESVEKGLKMVIHFN
jgi:hypothetical protein